ncbi:MAG: hypothetical protein KJ067_24290 [Vicinamibacteria bacterium]|nr:hypothetical protein [Vicinamibacteria bacterium]
MSTKMSPRVLDDGSTSLIMLSGEVVLAATRAGVGTQVRLTGLTTDDGRSGTATTSYTYSGGAANREARRFLGLRDDETIRQDLPYIAGETQCSWIETQFRQDLPAVGRPPRVER